MKPNRIFKPLFSLLALALLCTCSAKLDPRYLSPGAPVITSVTPATGVVSGGTLLTVTGKNFRTGLLKAVLGGNTCAIQSVTPTQFTCITAAHASNSVDLVVTATDTLEVGKLSNAFGYVAFLYAPSEVSPNKIDGFVINPFTGALTRTPNSPYSAGAGSNNGYGINVHPSNKFLYVSNLNTNNVTGFSINTATGELTLLTPTSAFASVSQAEAIYFSPDGNFMYAAGLGTPANVMSYNVNTTTGAVSPIGGAVAVTGCNNASQITTDPNNKYLFVSCTGNGSGGGGSGLAVMSIAADGSLTHITGGVCATGVCGGGSGDAITMDITGNFVYMGQVGVAGVLNGSAVANGGVAWYQIDLTTGIPSSQGIINHGDNSALGSGSSVETTGSYLVTSARASGTVQMWQLVNGIPVFLQDYGAAQGVTADTNDARFDKTGRFMYTSCTNSGTIDSFTVNLTNGTLTHIASQAALGTKPGVMDITY